MFDFSVDVDLGIQCSAGLAGAPSGRCDAGRIRVLLVRDDRVRNALRPRQERNNLLLAVNGRVVRAVVRRAGEEL